MLFVCIDSCLDDFFCGWFWHLQEWTKHTLHQPVTINSVRYTLELFFMCFQNENLWTFFHNVMIFILPCRVTAHWSHSKSFGDLLAHRSSQLLRSDVRDHQLSGLLAVFSLPASLCIKHQHWEKVLEESEQHRSDREEAMSGFYVVYLLVMNLHMDMGSVLETQ